MIKKCTKCDVELTEINKLKAGNRTTSICKGCHTKKSIEWKRVNSEKSRSLQNAYVRRVGIVKEYPCSTCKKPCLRSPRGIFCSLFCRFFSYVDKTDSCWQWTGKLDPNGYGKMHIRGRSTQSNGAHRISYELFKGTLEEGKFICHTCDIRSCVNPDHLWQGSPVEKVTDMVDKERQYSRLLPMQVYEIRKAYKNKELTSGEIIIKYNISRSHFYSIIHRRKWTHI